MGGVNTFLLILYKTFLRQRSQEQRRGYLVVFTSVAVMKKLALTPKEEDKEVEEEELVEDPPYIPAMSSVVIPEAEQIERQVII